MKTFIRRWIALCLAAAVSASALPGKLPPPTRFEKEIAAFAAADKTNAPPQNAILFTGSSTIRLWSGLAKTFPNHKIINRGFGGSMFSDAVYYFDQLVTPYKPKMVVIYSGSNDINAGKTPAEVAADCKTFVEKVEHALPDAKVAVISINASPSRWKDHQKVKEANRLIAGFMSRGGNRIFIDTYSAMLAGDGSPRPELYKADRLHPNAKGYAIWTPIIGLWLKNVDGE